MVVNMDLGDMLNDYKKKEVVDIVKDYNKAKKVDYHDSKEITE
jgi:hypothetical protein